ncbi:hypothetical protein NM688_g6989 [Phlebia brevispora]|uniref:Uncharacterized protein n=1 Tax=Phlebia brevispora TaxID=194682 RepID=A0ACC1SA87_9APHY|nr:hypothetical protein NM688_g6989 [Phlebia brevispora]
MIRLQSALATAMDLANCVSQREAVKREYVTQTKAMWEKHFALVDLKWKFPSFGGKEDEELFQDRERVPKRIKTEISKYISLCISEISSQPFSSDRIPLKLCTPCDDNVGSPIIMEPMMKPKD